MVTTNHPGDPDANANLDALIGNSGLIGRQILKLYRFMRAGDDRDPEATGLKGYWLRRQKLRQRLSALGVSRLADLLYTYYIGGSLTRQDQMTFARLNGLGDRPHRLTAVNALACGIPTAIVYFTVGEGFHLLSAINSYTELPGLFIGHTALATGAISLGVDLFRAADALLNKRCWAPFGLLPMLINIPTYAKRFASKLTATAAPAAIRQKKVPLRQPSN